MDSEKQFSTLLSHPIDSPRDHFAVGAIVVPYEIFLCNIPWKSLYDLLSSPSSSRVLGYINMNNSTPFVKHDYKYIKHTEEGCRNCKEVDRCHRFGFIGNKGFPCWRRASFPFDAVTIHACLAD